MAQQKSDNHNNKLSFLDNLKTKLKSFVKDTLHPNKKENPKAPQDDDESGSGSGSGSIDKQTAGDLGTGFLDSETQRLHVKELETILYDELQKDPEAMNALRKLTNGQITGTEINDEFDKVRNSEVAMQAIVNSEFAPKEVKDKARQELQRQHETREKLQAKSGFKPRGPGM